MRTFPNRDPKSLPLYGAPSAVQGDQRKAAVEALNQRPDVAPNIDPVLRYHLRVEDERDDRPEKRR
jgi:hypothetical protein